jgi:ABC-type polysaccharide/polyol phosphate transport system ATPase subunit
MTVIARLADVGKRYVKYDDVPSLVTGVRHMLRRGKRGRLWAVRHLDLELNRGDSVAIIGRNGSGKSTTLSMLAGVTAPTEGSVQLKGRLAPLLRLGVGFDQELTGRENVYMNGMILGMTEKEIAGRFDDIVAFSELEEFIDTPVKFYSSGMLVRLGFASAVSASPDVLVVDEVLAVGDVSFQMRSFDRMLEMRDNGATLVVVTHNMQAVRHLANSAIVLHDGTAVFSGSTADAISKYHELQQQSMTQANQLGGSDDASVTVTSFEVMDAGGYPAAHFSSGECATFVMRARFNEKASEAAFGIAISTESAQFVYVDSSVKEGLRTFDAGEYTFRFIVPLNLVSGSYHAAGALQWGKTLRKQARGETKVFYVSGRAGIGGIADLGATLEVDGSSGNEAPAAFEQPERP